MVFSAGPTQVRIAIFYAMLQTCCARQRKRSETREGRHSLFSHNFCRARAHCRVCSRALEVKGTRETRTWLLQSTVYSVTLRLSHIRASRSSGSPVCFTTISHHTFTPITRSRFFGVVSLDRLLHFLLAPTFLSLPQTHFIISTIIDCCTRLHPSSSISAHARSRQSMRLSQRIFIQ